MSATGIGAAVRRKEDFRFITGKGQYTDDISRPGETRAAFVRSPHAHAKIKRIDAAAASKMPGVLAVLTGAELANDNPGIASYDSTTGKVLRRYEIECDEEWSGPMTATAGTPAEPAPPQFVALPEPEPPPDDEWQQRALAAEAKVREWEEWNQTSQGRVPA